MSKYALRGDYGSSAVTLEDRLADPTDTAGPNVWRHDPQPSSNNGGSKT